MSLRNRKRCLGGGLVLAAACLCGLWFSQAYSQKPRSQPAESLIPAKVLLYYSHDSADAHREAREKTATYEAFSKTGFNAAAEKFVVGLIQLVGAKKSGSAKVDVAKIVRSVKQAWLGGLSFALAAPEPNGPPIPWAQVVLHHSAELEPELSTAIVALFEGRAEPATVTLENRRVKVITIPSSPGVEIGWWSEGDHLVIAAGLRAIPLAVNVASGKSANLTSNELFQKYSQATQFEQTSVSWLDFALVRKTYAAMPLPVPNGRRPVSVDDFIRAFGLDNLQSVVGRSGYRDRANWSEAELNIAGERRGLLALCGQELMTIEDLPPIPSATAGFVAVSFDAGKAYDTVISVVNQVLALGPERDANKGKALLENLPNILGFDLKAGLLDPLGNRCCLYSDLNQSSILPGGALVFSVDDERTLSTTLAQLIERAQRASRGKLSVQRVEKQGRETVVLQIIGVPFSLCYAIHDKWGVVALSPQDIDSFYLRLAGDLDHWQPTAEEREALKLLPERFTSLTYSDPRISMRGLIASAPFVLNMVQTVMQTSRVLAPGESLPISIADIPSAELVTRPLFTNFSVTTSDEHGVHSYSRTSTPAIPFVAGNSGGSSVATVGVLTALLLPAVQQARAAARRTQSKNNMKQIGLAMHNFHDTWRSFPRGTIENKNLKVEDRLSWYVDLLPYIDEAALYTHISRDKGWNDPANRNVAATGVKVFLDPQQPVQPGQACYVGIAGLGKDGPTLAVDHKRAGIFAYDRTTRIRDIRDGTSNTMMVSEANKDLGSWAAGGKATIRPLTTKPYINGKDGLGGGSPHGCHVLMADGSVRFVSNDVDPSVMEAMATINGGEIVQQP